MHPKRLFALMVIANQLADCIHQGVQREKRNDLCGPISTHRVAACQVWR